MSFAFVYVFIGFCCISYMFFTGVFFSSFLFRCFLRLTVFEGLQRAWHDLGDDEAHTLILILILNIHIHIIIHIWGQEGGLCTFGGGHETPWVHWGLQLSWGWNLPSCGEWDQHGHPWGKHWGARKLLVTKCVKKEKHKNKNKKGSFRWLCAHGSPEGRLEDPFF